MVCLFWKTNKLSSDFWNRRLGQSKDGGNAKWRFFRKPKFLNQMDTCHSEIINSIHIHRQYEGCLRWLFPELILLEAPLSLKPPHVKLKSKHNTACKTLYGNIGKC